MADEVTPAAEPTQETEGGAPESTEVQETQETEKRPEWLDTRFKTVEDQAKAYREAEKMAQQKSQRAAELERQNQELYGRSQQAQQPAPQEPNYDELFWQKPTEVINNLLGRQVQAAIQPFVESGYKSQKSKYANDPDFKNYEGLIDQVVSMQPQLKSKDGVVDELYRVVRAMDPEYENRIRERIRIEQQQKIHGGVEGAGTPAEPKATPKANLTADEQVVARRFWPDLPAQEAYKKYENSKNRISGGA